MGPPSPAEAAASAYCGSLAPGYRQVRGDQEPADQAAGSGQLRSRIHKLHIFICILFFCFCCCFVFIFFSFFLNISCFSYTFFWFSFPKFFLFSFHIFFHLLFFFLLNFIILFFLFLLIFVDAVVGVFCCYCFTLFCPGRHL